MGKRGVQKLRKQTRNHIFSYNPFFFPRVTVFPESQTNIRDGFLLCKSRLIGCFPHNRNKLPCFTLSLFIETKRQPYVYRGHWEQHPVWGPLTKNKLQILPGLGILSIPQRNITVAHFKSLHPTCLPFLSRRPHAGLAWVSALTSPQWLTVIWKCKPNKPFPLLSCFSQWCVYVCWEVRGRGHLCTSIELHIDPFSSKITIKVGTTYQALVIKISKKDTQNTGSWVQLKLVTAKCPTDSTAEASHSVLHSALASLPKP